MQELIQKFTMWVKLKIRLHIDEAEPVYFREREIWWCSLGVNIGHEQNGKNEKFERPVLILRKFNKHLLWALPLTSKPKEIPYHYRFNHEKEAYAVILSQIRTVSSRRLLRRVRTFPKNQFQDVKDQLTEIIKTNASQRDAFVDDSSPRGKDLGANTQG